MSMDLLVQAIGVIGVTFLISAFYLNNFKRRKIRRKTKIYNGLNFFGSLLLVIYSFYLGSMLFVVFNTIWALTAAYFLYQISSEEAGHKDITQILK